MNYEIGRLDAKMTELQSRLRSLEMTVIIEVGEAKNSLFREITGLLVEMRAWALWLLFCLTIVAICCGLAFGDLPKK